MVRALVADGHRVVVMDDGSAGDIRRVSNLPVGVRLADVTDGALVLEAARGCEALIDLAAVVGVGRAMRQRIASLERTSSARATSLRRRWSTARRFSWPPPRQCTARLSGFPSARTTI